MVENTNGSLSPEKLSQIDSLASLVDALGLQSIQCWDKKRTYKRHKLVKGHIATRKVNGKTYYTYRRGTDKEVYLGDADTILEAVLMYKGV